MGLLVTYIFPVAILLHSGMALKFLSDICYREPNQPGLVIGGRDSSVDAPCNRIFTDEGRCVANHSLYGDNYLLTVQDVAGFQLARAEEM